MLYTDVNRVESAEKDMNALKIDLETLLKESDFVSVHTDLNAQTKGMFNANLFKQMKKTAVFINTARGPLVDQKAHRRCTAQWNHLRGRAGRHRSGTAAADHELYKLPNCVIAPHIASATVQTRNEMARICAENVIAGVSGAKLPALVNQEVEGKRRK